MLDPRELLPAARARAAGQPGELDLPDLRRRARRYERRRRVLTASAVLLPLLAVVLVLVVPLRATRAPAGERPDLAQQPEVTAVPPALGDADRAPAQPPPREQAEALASPSPSRPPSPSPSPSPPPAAVITPEGPAATGPGPHRLWIEAEDAALTPPMLVHQDGEAGDSSRGASVLIEDGVTDRADLPRPGAVDLDIEVPQAATYVIWARVRAPDHDANSLFASVDGGEAVYWWLPPSPGWQWVPVTDRGMTTPKHYALSAGAHSLRFANREDGVALDQILVTSAVDDRPDALVPAP